MTDSPIINAARQKALFEAAALPLAPALYNTALRLTRQPADAGDLVQETYLRAYRTFQNFTPGTNCKAWLFTILYSIFVNQYRKEQRAPKAVSLEEVEEKFQHCLTISAAESFPAFRAGELSAEVNQALNQLPETFRLAVLLVDVEEFSYEEAAVILQCPVGTIRSRLFRGRKLLFVELAQYAQQKGYA